MVIGVQPLVSIITPVYNGSEYLEALIQSVLNQDYPNIEHLIIDDGSQDNGATVSILRRHPHLRWWTHANKGQYATMNEGLLAANGEVICFVSADDLVSPGAVSLVIKFLSMHLSYDGVFGKTGRIDSKGEIVPYYIPFQTAPLSFYPYFAHISHCSLYLKKESLNQNNLLFDPSLYYVGDYEWMIRLHKARLQIGSLRCELSQVRIHANQASQQHSGDSLLESRKVRTQHKIDILSYAFLNTLYRFLFKIWYLAQLIKSREIYTFVRHKINGMVGRIRSI